MTNWCADGRSLLATLSIHGWAAVLVATSWCAASSAIAAEQSGQQADSGRAAIALEALSRLKGVDLETNPALKTGVFKVLEQVRGTPQFVEIVHDFKITGQEEALLQFAG